MARRSYRPEQIISKLGKAEVLLSQGSSVGKAARKIRITDETYYRWRREYGAIRIGEVRRPKELELARLIFFAEYREVFLNAGRANTLANSTSDAGAAGRTFRETVLGRML